MPLRFRGSGRPDHHAMELVASLHLAASVLVGDADQHGRAGTLERTRDRTAGGSYRNFRGCPMIEIMAFRKTVKTRVPSQNYLRDKLIFHQFAHWLLAYYANW